jgi:hypothetical protein
VKLGFENKKEMAILGVLLVVACIMIYRNVLSGTSSAPARPATAAAQPAALAPLAPLPASEEAAASAPRKQRAGGEEFHPVMRSKRLEDRIDPMKVDPTLRLEVLARLQSAGAESNGRNVFQFGAPPPPPTPKGAAAAAMRVPEPVVIPQQRPVTANVPSGPPPPPPIPLKFYGMSKVVSSGKKDAFFKQGETILIASEGQMLLNRYRVGRIGVNSVLVEDTQLKVEQSLPLAENADAP